MITQTPAGRRSNASAPPLRVPGGQPVPHDSAEQIEPLTLSQMTEVRDLVRGALTGLLDEIILGIGTVGRVEQDYPAGGDAAEAQCWRRVAGKFSELARSGAP